MHNIWFQLLVILTTAGLGWLTLYVYRIYQRGQLLSAMPGPPRRSGLLNMVLGNLPDLAGGQNHLLTTQWSRQYGGMTLLRLFHTHVRCMII